MEEEKVAEKNQKDQQLLLQKDVPLRTNDLGIASIGGGSGGGVISYASIVSSSSSSSSSSSLVIGEEAAQVGVKKQPLKKLFVTGLKQVNKIKVFYPSIFVLLAREK